jgi:hypothetical protein
MAIFSFATDVEGAEFSFVEGAEGVHRRNELLQRIGFRDVEDVEYLTAEDVEALGGLLKPLPRRRLQGAWADMQAAFA